MKTLLKYIKPLIIILIIAVIAFIGFNFYKNSSVVKVEQVQVETVDIKKTVSASGQVTSDKAADLAFNATTKLINLNVFEDELVQQNTLVATGDTSSVYNNSKAANAALQQAIVDRDQFIEDYADNLEGIGGRENYELQLKKRVEAVNQAQFNYNATTTGYTNYNLTAPFTGTVTKVHKEQGENVVAGSPIVTLVDLTSLHFEALVDQEDIGVIELGQQVEVTLDSYEEPLMGTVSKIPNYIDTATGTINVQVTINPDVSKPLFYGQSGDVEIVTNTKANVQALQFDTFFSDEGDSLYLWTVENEVLKKLPVTVGMEGDIYTEVVEDLGNTTVVIPVDSKQELQEGSKVKLVQ